MPRKKDPKNSAVTKTKKVKNPKRIAAGKKAKSKGSRGERELVNWLKENGITSARRTQQYSGADGDSDVVASDEFPGLFIESKRYAKSVLSFELVKSWIIEFIEKCPEEESPVIFFRADKQEYIGIMFIDFFSLLIKGNEVSKYFLKRGGPQPNDFNKELKEQREIIRNAKLNIWAGNLLDLHLWERERTYGGGERLYPSFVYTLSEEVGLIVMEGEHLLNLLKRHYLKIPLSECTAS